MVNCPRNDRPQYWKRVFIKSPAFFWLSTIETWLKETINVAVPQKTPRARTRTTVVSYGSVATNQMWDPPYAISHPQYYHKRVVNIIPTWPHGVWQPGFTSLYQKWPAIRFVRWVSYFQFPTNKGWNGRFFLFSIFTTFPVYLGCCEHCCKCHHKRGFSTSKWRYHHQ